jgi:hypothetical protein
VVAEANVYDAIETTVAVEVLAKQQAYAALLGTPAPYSRDEIEGYFRRVGEQMWSRSGYKRWLWYERRLREKGLV